MTSPHTQTTAASAPETVKNARIQPLLAFFVHYNKKANRAADDRLWMVESQYRKSATDAAEIIFDLLGLTNGQEDARRQTADSGRGSQADGLRQVHYLCRTVRHAQTEADSISFQSEGSANHSLL